MAKIKLKILVTILILLVINRSIFSIDHTILKIDTCKYKFDDGKIIDLSSLDRPSAPR
jgi:hypothetical protein